MIMPTHKTNIAYDIAYTITMESGKIAQQIYKKSEIRFDVVISGMGIVILSMASRLSYKRITTPES
jgi:hypothetical protein